MGVKDKIIDYMAIVDRTGKVKWDNNMLGNPGKIYSNLIHNNDLENIKNSTDISVRTNETEMIGLLDDLEELKEELVYFSYFSSMPSKVK